MQLKEGIGGESRPKDRVTLQITVMQNGSSMMILGSRITQEVAHANVVETKHCLVIKLCKSWKQVILG
jgi:hypothetical protein